MFLKFKTSVNAIELTSENPKLGKLSRRRKNVRIGCFFSFFGFLNFIPIEAPIRPERVVFVALGREQIRTPGALLET